ncbi:MAG: flagellar assembly protein FliH, partial [Polaromonas sp.]|nr:flagellar assembly protein FliH [Polaromonas sp.]
MSSSKPQQTAWERWEMVSFAPELQPDVAPAAAAPELKPMEPAPLIDEAALARLRLEAQKAGETAGHEKGYASGLAQGHATGLAAVQAQAGQLQALTLALPAALRLAE